jgi:RNA polymerase sigma-70 factor (ECF subfamily)
MDGVMLDQVVAAARAGDRDAFGTLWGQLSPRVAGYFRAHGNPEPDDATSEVFLAAFRQMDRFTGDGSGFTALVFTIAHRRHVDATRRRVRRPELAVLDEETPLPPTASAEDLAMREVGTSSVIRLLSTLTPDQRAVLTLRVVADLTLQQTAQILGRDVGSVKALQHRALARLRKEVSSDPYPSAAVVRLNPRHA